MLLSSLNMMMFNFGLFQNGGECLRAFASVGLEQVMVWHDEQGRTWLSYHLE